MSQEVKELSNFGGMSSRDDLWRWRNFVGDFELGHLRRNTKPLIYALYLRSQVFTTKQRKFSKSSSDDFVILNPLVSSSKTRNDKLISTPRYGFRQKWD